MTAPALILTEHLTDNLRLLCTQPSTTGRSHELEQTAGVVERLMSRAGLQTQRIATGGAPVVLGTRAGKEPFTLLLYHHYDTAAAGAWRDWHHEPYTLAERDGALYARGVAEAKGPLAAHLSALEAQLAADPLLPCNIIVVAEGEGLAGSTHLSEVLAAHPELLHADACLASVGARDAHGTPYCYSGSKGQLRARLSTHSAEHSLSVGLAATVPSPLWRLLWALTAIKGEDEDIKITGFYDAVDGPSRDLNRAMRSMALDEAERLEAWKLPQFLFGMTGSSLVRAEVTLPTCNLSSITVEPVLAGVGIPSSASALLDFQLVPNQNPIVIGELLNEYLLSKGFTDITCELLPGGYGPAFTHHNDDFIRTLSEAGAGVYGTAPSVLPLGPFATPLSLFQRESSVPVGSIGIQRPDNRSQAANEHILLPDLLRHGQLLIELMWACSERVLTPS